MRKILLVVASFMALAMVALTAQPAAAATYTSRLAAPYNAGYANGRADHANGVLTYFSICADSNYFSGKDPGIKGIKGLSYRVVKANGQTALSGSAADITTPNGCMTRSVYVPAGSGNVHFYGTWNLWQRPDHAFSMTTRFG